MVRVLVTGGFNSSDLASAELYDVGLAFNSAWQPQIATAPSTLAPGSKLALTGSLFQGVSQASGGNSQDSSSNYPVVQLRSLDNSQVMFLQVDSTVGWSNTAFTSTPVSGFPAGPALVTVFTNAIPSAAKYLVVALAPTSVVSRKTHGSAGNFDINLPLTGTAGVECRTGGTTADHQLVLTFPSPISINGSPQAQVTSGIGQIGSGGTSNGGVVTLDSTKTMVTVPLTNVSNAQRIVVTLYNVSDGTTTTNLTIPMGVLVGDVNGTGLVDSGDVFLVRQQTGQGTGSSNFREDVNASGLIDSGDVFVTRQHTGTSLPQQSSRPDGQHSGREMLLVRP